MEIHFNIEDITSIIFEPSELSETIKWLDEEIIETKKFFGLIKKSNLRVSGWYELCNYLYSDSKWLLWVKTKDKTLPPSERYFVKDGIIYLKPIIRIQLKNGDKISHRFNSDVEAKSYINELKNKCKNKFEVINYE